MLENDSFRPAAPPATAQGDASKEEAFLKRLDAAFAEYRECSAFVEALVNEGRVLPREQAGLTAYLQTRGRGTVAFSEDGQGGTGDAQTWLRGFLSRLPVVVSYGEVAPEEEAGYGEASLPPGYTTEAESMARHRRILAYAGKHNLPYVDAMRMVGGLA